MTGWQEAGLVLIGAAFYVLLALPLACLVGRLLHRNHPED